MNESETVSDDKPTNSLRSALFNQSAYKRLFGTVSLVTDQFCSFEHLEQWLEDNKREQMNLPLLEPHESVCWARQRNAVNVSLSHRKRLLQQIGVFDVAIGDEPKALRKSHIAFRTADQVASYWNATKARKEKKEAELKAKGPFYPTETITRPVKDGALKLISPFQKRTR